MQIIVTTVYTAGSMITVLATLCDRSALNGVTMREVSSMPNVRTWLTLMSFVDFFFVDIEKNIGFGGWMT